MYIPELQREVRPEYINGLIGFIDFARDVTKTDCIFDISEAFRHTETNKLAIEYIKSQPGVGQLVEERYLAPTPDLENLLKLPKDSLGYIYAYNMKKANFDPEFYRKVQIADDMTYLILRQRQTHDIWHTVTGFGTDSLGELGLQGFALAQTHGPLSVAIMAGGLLNTLLTSSEHLTHVINIFVKGYNIGIKAKPFLAQKWEENWEKPLAEWRAELGVEAVS
ncbi:Coq4 family protein [Microseira sp. BLCC-F43]|jgi:ubiquinone biosynthesis protein Coq4|uniref:Coq4 family protein n=1 Tax=Microseira sp. BLCC-F43 TaxID=3153602 RepID=UPI0035B792EE